MAVEEQLIIFKGLSSQFEYVHAFKIRKIQKKAGFAMYKFFLIQISDKVILVIPVYFYKFANDSKMYKIESKKCLMDLDSK